MAYGIREFNIAMSGQFLTLAMFGLNLYGTRSLEALRAPTSSWGPFGPLDFVLRALRP